MAIVWVHFDLSGSVKQPEGAAVVIPYTVSYCYLKGGYSFH